MVISSSSHIYVSLVHYDTLICCQLCYVVNFFEKKLILIAFLFHTKIYVYIHTSM